ncbi:hypothetical protein V6N13_016970 [Hibiscus sabdariffa]
MGDKHPFPSNKTRGRERQFERRFPLVEKERGGGGTGKVFKKPPGKSGDPPNGERQGLTVNPSYRVGRLRLHDYILKILRSL